MARSDVNISLAVISDTSTDSLPDAIECIQVPTLPTKKASLYRTIRYRLFNVYKRLFTGTFLVNIVTLAWLCVQSTEPTFSNIGTISIPISANILAAVLFRTEDFINLLYLSVLWIPVALPLRLRLMLARVYHFGGVHSGTAVAGTLWTVLFCVQVIRGYLQKRGVTAAIFGLTLVILLLLLFILASAQPSFRKYQHDMFEAIHRFCGWSSIILFWAVAIEVCKATAAAENQTTLYAVFHSPTIYLLMTTTFLLFLPWLRLRRITIHAETPSDHVTRLYIPGRRAKPTQTIRLSTSPLFEWHSFAILPSTWVPTGKGEIQNDSMSILVSSAGNWTNSVIADSGTERKYWIRGVPTTGVTAVTQLFQRAVVVCTGSGIGPCLSLLSMAIDQRRSPKPNWRLIWSTQAPCATYGDQVLREVEACDPNAVIWDTREKGRPNLIALTKQIFHEMNAEVVMVVSNQKVTTDVVFGLEAAGIPAFGPIFDS